MTLHRTSLLLTAATLSVVINAAEADSIKLKLSHFVPTQIGLHKQFMEPWARELETCTEHAVAVEIHPGGSAFGHIAKQFDQVKAGVVDIAFGHTGIPRGRFPRTSLIELPFVAKSANASSRALSDLAESHLKPEYPGVKILGMMAHNPGVIHTTKPVNSTADLKGLRIRTPNPSISAVLEHYGATPVGLPPGQIYESLQKGTIDGVTIDWTGIAAYKLNEVTDYHYDVPLYTVGFFFVMNQKRYEGLPDIVKQCVDEISGETLVAKFGPWWDAWGQRGLDLEQAAGDSIIVASPEEQAQWKKDLEPVTEALIKSIEESGVDNAREILAALIGRSALYE